MRPPVMRPTMCARPHASARPPSHMGALAWCACPHVRAWARPRTACPPAPCDPPLGRVLSGGRGAPRGARSAVFEGFLPRKVGGFAFGEPKLEQIASKSARKEFELLLIATIRAAGRGEKLPFGGISDGRRKRVPQLFHDKLSHGGSRVETAVSVDGWFFRFAGQTRDNPRDKSGTFLPKRTAAAALLRQARRPIPGMGTRAGQERDEGGTNPRARKIYIF